MEIVYRNWVIFYGNMFILIVRLCWTDYTAVFEIVNLDWRSEGSKKIWKLMKKGLKIICSLFCFLLAIVFWKWCLRIEIIQSKFSPFCFIVMYIWLARVKMIQVNLKIVEIFENYVCFREMAVGRSSFFVGLFAFLYYSTLIDLGRETSRLHPR